MSLKYILNDKVVIIFRHALQKYTYFDVLTNILNYM